MLKYDTSKELLRLSQIFLVPFNRKFTCVFDNIGNLYSITYIIFNLMFVFTFRNLTGILILEQRGMPEIL